jgi:N-methylhydantoinase B/oxoprolinase/acetone carboxylase alpha subunit
VESYFILINGKIQQEEITIVNIYVPNVSAPNLIKQTLLDLKAQIDQNTMVVEDLNTLLLHFCQ